MVLRILMNVPDVMRSTGAVLLLAACSSPSATPSDTGGAGGTGWSRGGATSAGMGGGGRAAGGASSGGASGAGGSVAGRGQAGAGGAAA